MASGGARIVQALRKSQAMGPSVRNLLSQYKLDPSQIASTGPHQTLLKGDVLSYLNQRSDKPPTVNKNPSSHSMAQGNLLSAPKAVPPSRPNSSQYISQTSKHYPRTALTQWEIDVINGGGIADPPAAPSSSKGTSKQTKQR
uniref:Peripheral subunit-binding (PSBD) domain-containing protein n=1 Tax=Aceria tosichella TaxID=561515 RepID=A0A6G1S4C3_9ACAR